MGGLSKKTFQIKSLSAKNTLLLDSGNLLFKHPSIPDGVNQARLTAKAIMEVYRLLDYDAVGVGPLDLAGGLEFLSRHKEQGFPWVSANLFNNEGNPVFQKWVRKKAGNSEIVITAITAQSTQSEGNLVIKPWESTLPGLLKEIKKEVKDPFIILLSSLPEKENQIIAGQYNDIHLILGGDQRKGNISPRLVGSTLFTQTSRQGKYQGLLAITFGSRHQWENNESTVLADMQNRLGSLNWQLKRLEKKAVKSGDGDKYTSSITRLQTETEELQRNIDLTKKRIEREKREGVSGNQYSSRFIALETNMPDDPAVAKRVSTLKLQIRELHQDKKAAALRSAHSNSLVAMQGMLGNNGCEKCHPVQTNFWKSTNHAKAYTTLVQRESNLDLECLPCHLTLDIQNPDHADISPTALLSFPSEFQSVGCESCHGAGKKHGEMPEEIKLVRRPAKEVCLECHTEDHDDNFIYDIKLPKVSCPTG